MKNRKIPLVNIKSIHMTLTTICTMLLIISFLKGKIITFPHDANQGIINVIGVTIIMIIMVIVSTAILMLINRNKKDQK